MARKKKITSSFAQQLRPLLQSTHLRMVLVALITTGIGYASITGLKAVSFATATEAESGVISGNAATANDTTASAASAVKFGSGAPAAPTAVKAITGGTSIALRWAPSPGAIKQYNIFRNGTQIGSIDPAVFNQDYPEKDGCGFVDKNVTQGTTYTYQVQAVSSANATSALSASITAKRPTSTTPTPTITYDLGGATDLDSYMKNVVVPFLKIWYPKVSDTIAFPDYTPSNSMNLVLDPTHSSIASTTWEKSTITFNTQFLRDNYNNPANPDRALGAWLHEATHVIQGNPDIGKGSNAQGFAVEGGADYAREYIIADRPPTIPTGIDYYTDGYGPGAYFINYIMNNYDSNYMRKITVDGHNQVFGTGDITFSNGKNIDEMWSQIRGLPNNTGPFKSSGTGKCIDGENGNTNLGAKVQLWDCINGTINQKMTAWPNADGTVSLHLLGNCLDVANSGTANGTIVWLFGCNRSNAQAWNIMPDGSIINPNSGRCLEITNAGNSGANGSQIQIWDCNGGGWQKWTYPANTPRQTTGPIVFRSATSTCLDDPNGVTTDGTQLQVWNCNGGVAQRWNLLKRTDGGMKITIGGKCVDVRGNGAANGAAVALWPCSNNASQDWQIQSNGSLKHLGGGRCLDTNTRTTANSSLFVVNDCNGSASQTFNFPN